MHIISPKLMPVESHSRGTSFFRNRSNCRNTYNAQIKYVIDSIGMELTAYCMRCKKTVARIAKIITMSNGRKRMSAVPIMDAMGNSRGVG